ncbi:MAG: helix-turn-helix domain-containing protein [Candidatus Omnitrophica bacterium]|nr:helix-turn-helix domain-containing protein [Candidatus Omnitrophota bacterium]
MKEYPEVMTVKQVAEYLQIDPQSVYKMAQRNKIPCAKIAGQWRFKKLIIDDWLNQKITKHEAVEIFEKPIKVEGQK